MKHIDVEEMRAQLEAEKTSLEDDLKEHGHVSKDTGDWQGSSNDSDTSPDPNVVADQIEELAVNVPMVESLEERYRAVKRALEKIEQGTYGTCDVGGEEIDADRLKANPAATTCVEHASQ